MVTEESSFPRGGIVKKVSLKKLDDNNDFGVKCAKEKKNKSKRKAKKVEEKPFTEDDFEANSADLLHLNVLKEDMLVYGLIMRIDTMGIHVSLPGRLIGFIKLTSISDEYTGILEKVASGKVKDSEYKSLSDMFSVGQPVYCKVMKMQSENANSIELSLNPKDLHVGIHFSRLNQGMVMIGTVSTFEDYGCQIDLGIANTKTFLPLKAENKGDLISGQIVYCRIEKVIKSNKLANLVVELANENRKVDIEQIVQLDNLFPTTQVVFTVLNKLKNGLSGKLMDGFFTGYINEHHLGSGKTVDSYEIGQDVTVTVLYTIPLSKFVYLTANKFVPEEKRLEHGQIIKKPKPVGVRSGGLILTLDKNKMGLIPFNKMKKRKNENMDKKELMSVYEENGVDKVRIISYSVADDLYICTDDDKAVQEKFFSLDDLPIGQSVTCTIVKKIENVGICVKIGQINGFIYNLHLNRNIIKSKPGAKVNARVFYKDYDKKSAHLTTLPELLKADKSKIISDRSEIIVGNSYVGVVRTVSKQLTFVDLFNKITGVIKSNDKQLKIGQVITTVVTKMQDSKIFLDFQRNVNIPKVDNGALFEGVLSSIDEHGIKIRNDNNLSVFIKPDFVTEFSDLASSLIQSFKKGSSIQALCLNGELFSIRDIASFEKYPMLSYNSVGRGAILRGFVKTVDNNSISVEIPLKWKNKLVKIPHTMVVINEHVRDKKSLFTKNQVIYVKVLNKLMDQNSTFTCSAKLNDVWNGNLYSSVNYLKTYFQQLDLILESIASESGFKFKVGDQVEGQVAMIEDDNVHITFGEKFKGQLVEGKSKVVLGDCVKCTILWIDGTGNIYLSNSPKLAEVKPGDSFLKYSKKAEKGEIVFKTDRFFVVLLDSNHFVYVPLKLHANDFLPILSDRTGTCSVVVLHTLGCCKFGIFEDVYGEAQRAGVLNESVDKKRKRKISDSKSEETLREIVSPTKSEPIPKKVKTEIVSQDVLSIPTDFWDLSFKELNDGSEKMETNNDELSDDGPTSPKKSKKEIKRLEEAKIRGIEEKLAKSTDDPVSVDEFDRILLADPNNSLLWIKFMAFHLHAMDLDKARAVARRALKSIDFREQEEILNIWVAFLNLEMRYGTKESFEGLLMEALRLNDQFKITMRTIQMLADAKKIDELKRRVQAATKTFKDKFQTWPIVATAFFQVHLVEEAKQFLNKALKFVDKHHHIGMIMEFAKLNNKFGDKETAHALLEQIVTSYPKRVDIWSVYVDMLAKDKQLDLARQVLERAISQKIPVKKMRTLFKKYLDFEMKYGTETTVENVKKMAAEYVENQMST